MHQKQKKSEAADSNTGGVYAHGDLSTMFLSLSGHITHEHYIKIVPSVFKPLNKKPVGTYDYTINSNLYESSKDDIPGIKVVWDIWPMEVVVTEARKPLVEGFCQMVGFLGGVFAFFMIFERFIYSAYSKLLKSREGKLT